jgi:hypothetical protein
LTVAGSLFFMKKSFKGSRVTIFFLGLKARTVPATVNRRFASLFREIHGHSLFFQKERGRLKKVREFEPEVRKPCLQKGYGDCLCSGKRAGGTRSNNRRFFL